MSFIKGFVCRGCGSTLGKRRTLPNGLSVVWCFTCCAGDFLLHESEVEGLEPEEIANLMGREWGSVRTIHKRLNTPGARCACRPSAEHARYQLHERRMQNVFKSKTYRHTEGNQGEQ